MSRLIHLSLALGAFALDDGSAEFYAQLGADAKNGGNATSAKVLLSEYVNATGAMCLDGSPGAYYIRKGVGDGANKWYIHHQGGGWCESWDDCLGRSHSQLGSSHGYPNYAPLGGGYFDPFPRTNPMMYNWNMVYLRYCDGGSFSGNNETVATYKNQKLYFRGKRVREAAYASLMASANLGAATDVVVSGCSAGGLATFLHTDQWCDRLAVDAKALDKCVGMPDSGFFLDYQDPLRTKAEGRTTGGRLGNTVSGDYHRGLKWVFDTMNTTSGINQDCINAHGVGGPTTDDPAYLCQFAEHTAPFTHTPLFPLQSEYDAWQTGHVLYYPNTGADVQVLGDNITKRLSATLLGPHPQSGAFLDSCWHHCGMWNQIRIDGDLVSTAFAKWYAGIDGRVTRRSVREAAAAPTKRLWKQGKPYKCDACCKPN